ncbi:MAG: prepilin peptidase [Verrucomicrobia bacterium]|nr:MAG: prepilin peptidase [Verrucomicrobiota bacterium]
MMETLLEIDTTFPWFFPAFAFCFGAIVGSFLNVCIYRIPEGRSIITPGSTCACGTPIPWHRNIPIFSWIVLRGRAPCCGRRFSIRYPAVELLTALLFLACWLQLPPVKALIGMVFVSILICATFIDLDHMIIPDRFTVGAAVLGVVLSALFPALHDRASGVYFIDAVGATFDSIVGVLISSGLVLWIALLAEAVLRKEAMGFGDVKFLGAIGAFLGWKGGVFAVFGGAILGTLVFAVVLLGHGLFGGRKRQDGADGPSETESAPVGFGRQTPFGPMLAAGAALYMLWLHPWVDAYFDTVAELLTAW